MKFEERIELAHKNLREKGVWELNYNPPLDRVLRKLGFRLPPPYYQSFPKNFIFILFSCTPIFLIVNFMVETASSVTFFYLFSESIIDGISFSVIMSAFYLIRRKQLKLKEWKPLCD
ncbi:conserved hypothetical protein [Vibrio chagasii]|uniref:DUF6404 family protein n=1 Tax=Vibrio TaxID=662 RepID=UPI000CF46708|nr:MULTISPECIES: DUF6404 family protein [Vibrio]CAH7301056.1 conserved hypothetical protein [Vibrio chagasii]NOI97277.1 hypothetical protein [Vibrio sp. T3Y01]PQJ51984.1 hypothetical protein BTO12_18935 [Vibrio splendidus]CAH7332562.1 conserved hypothetical protein [Vibrio chagasii]CAH7455537.1 conserved hypothetical protein [Vibrio chagasii]